MAATVTTTGNNINPQQDYNGYGPYQTGDGGEFTLQVSSDLSWILSNNYVESLTKDVAGITNSFQTFCVETTEYINSNTTYNVTISNSIISGGAGASNLKYVSLGTASLCSQFATGGLAKYGYIYNSGGAQTANLQNAIWMLERRNGVFAQSVHSGHVGCYWLDVCLRVV